MDTVQLSLPQTLSVNVSHLSMQLLWRCLVLTRAALVDVSFSRAGALPSIWPSRPPGARHFIFGEVYNTSHLYKECDIEPSSEDDRWNVVCDCTVVSAHNKQKKTVLFVTKEKYYIPQQYFWNIKIYIWLSNEPAYNGRLIRYIIHWTSSVSVTSHSPDVSGMNQQGGSGWFVRMINKTRGRFSAFGVCMMVIWAAHELAKQRVLRALEQSKSC